MDNGHALGFDLLDDVLGGSRALIAIQTNGAQGQLVTALGDLGVGGGGGDHQDPLVFIDVGGGQGIVGAEVADHKLDAVVHHLVRDSHRLFGIAGIVIDDRFDLLAIDTASLVDLLDRHLAAGELHVPVLGYRTGDRACDTDLDGVCRVSDGDRSKQSQRNRCANCDFAQLMH